MTASKKYQWLQDEVEVLDMEGSSCAETELEIKLAGLANGKDAGLRKEEAKTILWFYT